MVNLRWWRFYRRGKLSRRTSRSIMDLRSPPVGFLESIWWSSTRRFLKLPCWVHLASWRSPRGLGYGRCSLCILRWVVHECTELMRVDQCLFFYLYRYEKIIFHTYAAISESLKGMKKFSGYEKIPFKSLKFLSEPCKFCVLNRKTVTFSRCAG